MSASIVLLPLSIGLCIAAKDCLSALSSSYSNGAIKMDTRFKDSHLLHKTLNEYGLCPKQISHDRFSVHFSDGDIIYDRPSADTPFVMTVQNIKDKPRLIKELTDIEQVYNGNVQEYTYQRVLNNLPEGMAIEHEEVLDDNSIVITVNVG